MSDRVDIRDGIISRIESETSYTAGYVKDFIREVGKGESENIVVILGDDYVDEIYADNAAYRCITEVYVQFVVRGSFDNAVNNDGQSSVETIAENICNALLRWNTIKTDVSAKVIEVEYDGIEVGEYASNKNYGARILFLVTYDKS